LGFKHKINIEDIIDIANDIVENGYTSYNDINAQARLNKKITETIAYEYIKKHGTVR